LQRRPSGWDHRAAGLAELAHHRVEVRGDGALDVDVAPGDGGGDQQGAGLDPVRDDGVLDGGQTGDPPRW
jgi:hypothetical protein